MAYNERKEIISRIETLRKGRNLICLLNFDRISEPPLPGLSIKFQSDLKESLYRVLKEIKKEDLKKGIDIFLYTCGGDTNAVWPIVSIIYEFDPTFEVIIPFRSHSAGTLLSLASKKIIMTKLSELSPIDPSTGNQFNPIDPSIRGARLGISVEDLNAYKDFIIDTYNYINKKNNKIALDTNSLNIFLQKLIDVNVIHPLAIGNVHRVYKLIKRLAEKLLKFNILPNENIDGIISRLTVEPNSHLHMFNRNEVKEILGDKIEFANEELELVLDLLLRQYEDDFNLRNTLFLSCLLDEPPKKIKFDKFNSEILNLLKSEEDKSFILKYYNTSDNKYYILEKDLSEDIKNKISDILNFVNFKTQEKDFRFIGGTVESKQWGYLFETIGKITQYSKLPPNINIQLPPGQLMPLIPGLPREFFIEINRQRWIHNKEPKGVTK